MLKISKKGNIFDVKPSVDFVASVADELKDELLTIIRQSPDEICLDLTGVKMIDSIGIGVLVATHNTITKAGGRLKLVNVGPNICDVISTMRLDRHFTVEKAK